MEVRNRFKGLDLVDRVPEELWTETRNTVQEAATKAIPKKKKGPFIGRTDAEAETPYLGYLVRRADSLGKTLMPGKIEGKRRRGWQRMGWLDSITDPTDMNLSKLREIVKDREAWHAAIHRVTKSWTQLSDRTLFQQPEQTMMACTFEL